MPTNLRAAVLANSMEAAREVVGMPAGQDQDQESPGCEACQGGVGPLVPGAVPVFAGVAPLTVFDRIVDDEQTNWPAGERPADTGCIGAALVAVERPFMLGCKVSADGQAQLFGVGW